MKRTLILVIAMLSVANLAQAQTAKPGAKTPAKPATTAPAKPAVPPQATPSAAPSRNAKPAADDINTWAKPLYRTTKGQEKTIVQVDKYPYRESTYTIDKPIEILAKDQYRFGTPEDSIVSRLSAMANLDYDGWLKTWDAKSQAFLKKLDARPDFGAQKRINQWRGVFAQVKPVLVRRIETGAYVIVTYKLVNKEGKDVGVLEYPTAMKQVGSDWLGTEELQNDALLNLSPWVSGKMSEEGEPRSMDQTVIK